MKNLKLEKFMEFNGESRTQIRAGRDPFEFGIILSGFSTFLETIWRKN